MFSSTEVEAMRVAGPLPERSIVGPTRFVHWAKEFLIKRQLLVKFAD